MKEKVRDLSDLDLAKMLEDQFQTENLLKTSSGIWFFDGSIWRSLSDDELKATATTLLAQKVDRVMRSRLTGMLEIFKTYNWISDARFELGDPNTVVMADGYRTYQSGKWAKIAPDRELRRRICLTASYTQERPVQFDKFLRDILCNAEGIPLVDSQALTDLIWEMLGYCLVTHTRYERCFILSGQGANGKSVLGAVAKAMVGRRNTGSVQPSQMSSVFQRSNLEGKLLNLVTELNQNEEMQDGLLKAIVSGEMMSVERKFQDVREIEPFAKHIILTNHLPRIRDYSDGLFRRVSIIPLQRQFLGAKADPLLINKLEGEMDAITSRALDALGRLIDRNGVFSEPPSCTDAKDTWRTDNNHIAQFLAERIYSDPTSRVTVQDLYDDYRHWFGSTGLRGQLGRKQFANRVEAAGVRKSSRQSAGYFFEGVSLR
jgi:putative DNA primase/helicase